MNWLSENYKWLFDGVAGAAVIAVIGYVVHRLLGSQDRQQGAAALTAQGAKVTNSPVASGSGITQTINSPTTTINFSVPEPTTEQGCDFWLSFDPRGSRPLLIQNSGAEPAFDVVVYIPADGSDFKSDLINRLENDNSVYCSFDRDFVYLESIRRVLAEVVFRGSDNGDEVKNIPVLIRYRTHRQQSCEFHLEIRLPLQNGIQVALPGSQQSTIRPAWPEEKGAHIATSGEAIPNFPTTLSGYRSEAGKDFWGKPFSTRGTIRVFQGTDWDGIWKFPNTMNGCSSGVFMIRWRSADPNVLIQSSAVNNAAVESRSQTKPGAFGYMSGTNCDQPMFKFAESSDGATLVDVYYELKFWQAAP